MLKQESEKMVFFFFKCTQDSTAVASKSRMSDNKSWLLGEPVLIY